MTPSQQPASNANVSTEGSAEYCHAPENTDVRVWRYMSVERFELLLEEGVFLARAHLLGDPREGSGTYRQALSRVFPRLRVKSQRTGERKLINEFFEDHGRWHRQWVCVSCWHMNDVESDAMWKLYGEVGKNVCVQSTFRRLNESLHSAISDAIWPIVGVVRYIDHRTDLMTSDQILAPFFHKAREFAHEREVRAVLEDMPVDENSMPKRVMMEKKPDNDGWALPVADLNYLIERVFVAPYSAPELAARVAAAMQREGVTAPLLRSAMETPPVF
jgi:hypothetical protein